MARHKADWSELYPELLTSIAGHLDTGYDVIQFRSVCKKWKSANPKIPPNRPLLSPLFPREISVTSPAYSASEDFFYGPRSGIPLFIVANTTFLIQPRHTQNPNPFKPWLITVEELNPGRFLLRKPLTRFVMKNFPENFPRVLDLSDYRVREIGKGYNYRCCDEPVRMSWKSFNNKVVLFFNPDSASHTIEDCYALVLRSSGNLLCARLEDEQDHTYLRYSRVSRFDDIVIYRGCVWAIDRKGRVYVIHYGNSLKLVMFSSDPVCMAYSRETRKRLVESSDGLYLIDRHLANGSYQDAVIRFRVYKLNEGEHRWEEVKSLDGRILFVSTDCCFLVSAEDFPRFGGNCIFFPKHHFPAYNDTIYPDEEYFKEASTELEIGVFHLDNGESALVSTYPGYSDIFWPPPAWLSPDTCSATWVGEEEEDKDPEVCCSQDMCPPSLSIEPKSQVFENPFTIGVQEHDEFMEVDISWSDIPSKLLSEIANHLKTRIDVCRFRAVCKKWRASIPPPPTSNILCSQLPRKISTTTAPFIKTTGYSFSSCSLMLVASTVYLLQPCDQSLVPPKSWLLTVEEFNPGQFALQLPLRRVALKKLPENFPSVLNLSNFHVSEIGKEYYFRDPNGRWDSWAHQTSSFGRSNKVVFFSDDTIGDTTALVLCNMGNLASLRLRDDHWSTVRYRTVTKFDDIVYSKGKIYTVDRKGRAYVISSDACTVSRIVDEAIGTKSGRDRQKRLVQANGKLYLLVRHCPREKILFRVYKLNKRKHKWVEVDSLRKRILFVTPSFCFLASARHFPGWKSNCIVFPPNCLPTYSGGTSPDYRLFKGTIKELEIGVFSLDTKYWTARPIKFYSGYSDLFWPPPAWLEPLGCPSRGLDRNQEVQMDSLSKYSQGISSISAPQDISLQKLAARDLTSTIAFLVQASSSGASTVSFQGVDIQSEFLPILVKIFDKYGNIAEDSMVHSTALVFRALESLAEAVLILKSSQGRSLDESQAEKLRSMLSNLQFIQFRVDWLVPFIEKALACQRSKLLLNSLRSLERVKAEVREMKINQSTSLAEIVSKSDDVMKSKLNESMKGKLREMARKVLDMKLAEIESKIDEETRLVTDDINALGPIDLEKCLGEGLC